NKVVPQESLMDEALGTARQLAEGATRAIGMMKKMLNSSFESDILTALDREASLQGISISTSDSIEGVMSFMQKREPNFRGR
ncbi:MAG: 2-(1,2-epoxy-1,2-dihydrophenyl)acetyl-CoA isomerase, partial [Actinobacteria bacterium]|nr:2-(1,2-epoxy-1,2-dihydrophenyl)acetyl-CoA isomerase [Actinomycetota bacterium]